MGVEMRVGVPKETKNHEYRVGLTPASAAELVNEGHEVWVERGAGVAIDFTDEAYQRAGAKVVSASDAFTADVVVKVKEPTLRECARLGRDQVLFTYLHLAAAEPQAKVLLASECTAIAYETVVNEHGQLPLLSPMCEVA